MSTAASVSSVGTSPAHAITTSGSPPSSLLAQSQMPMPRSQCRIAASMSSHCGAGCLPATITLTRLRLRRQWSATDSSVLASGGRYTRTMSAFLFTTWSMKPGSWWEKPLWSWRQTCEVSR